MNPPTTQLQPGSTGAAVTQLQQYLVANGYMTQAQMNSGPGTYGPQTTAAVEKMQQALGVNNSSGPGYYGPLTIAAAQTKSNGSILSAGPNAGTANPLGQGTMTQGTVSNPTATSTATATKPATVTPAATTTSTPVSTPTSTSTSTSTPASTTSTTGQGVPYSATYGANGGPTAAQWASMSPTQQATYAAASAAGTAIQANTGNTTTLAAALAAAAQDPVIIAKYADALSMDKEAFTQNLQQIQTAVSTTSQTQRMQFESDRLALANQSAAAGQAYSGYRGLAEQNLATTESGIVTSSRSALQAQLDSATAAFEAKYGTAATTAATASFVDPNAASNTSISGLAQTPDTSSTNLTGGIAGGITGTQAPAETADIQSEASQIVNQGKTNPVVAASS